MSDAVVRSLTRAVDLAGGQTELANKVNQYLKSERLQAKPITQKKVWNWLNRDKKVPGEYGIPIEVVVGGKVSRYQLCPAVFGKAPKIVPDASEEARA